MGREGCRGTRPLTGQGEDKEQSPPKLALAGGLAVEGSFCHPLFSQTSSPIPLLMLLRELMLEEIYSLAFPVKCPPLCYDSTLGLRFDIKSRECKGSSWLSSVLEWTLNFQIQSLINAAIGNHNSAFPSNSCYHNFAGVLLSKHFQITIFNSEFYLPLLEVKLLIYK